MDRITNVEKFLKKLKLTQSATIKPMVTKTKSSSKSVSVNQPCARKSRSKSMSDVESGLLISKRIVRPPQRYVPVDGNTKTIKKSDKVRQTNRSNVRKAPNSSETSAEEKIIKKPFPRLRSKSVFIEPVAKPILKKSPAARRQRSKTVSFDLPMSPGSSSEERVDVQAHPSSLSNNPSATSNNNMLNGPPNLSYLNEQHQNVSFDMEVEVATSNNGEEFGTHYDSDNNNDLDVVAMGSVQDIVDRMVYLSRANQTKSNRIQELINDRNFVVKRLETAHNMNLMLTQTVDEYRANENVQPINQAAQQEIGGLRERIEDLNRINFDLSAENTKLKTVVRSYSKKVLAEHNYNLL